jgi:hypothetical protein
LSWRGKEPRNVGKRTGADLLLNFRELRTCEVRRISLLRGCANRPVADVSIEAGGVA